MLNFIKEITTCSFNATQVDTEELHLGFDLTLPPEMHELLSERNKDNTGAKSWPDFETDHSLLDEHELALS